MRADDHVVEVGFRQHGIEEGPRVRQAVLSNEACVCHKAIAPIHLDGALRCSLHEEEGVGAELQAVRRPSQCRSVIIDRGVIVGQCQAGRMSRTTTPTMK